MIGGHVVFRLGSQRFALGLEHVREIVRLQGVEQLPGTQPPMAGVVVLREYPLPIFDVRGPGPHVAGDLLVLDIGGDLIGVAVDQVSAVAGEGELPPADELPSRRLPAYVIGIRKSPSGPVFLVDVGELLDAVVSGWAEALYGTVALVQA